MAKRYRGPLPNRIRELREARQMTQDELAERVETSKMQISRLERGERRLTQGWMERISQALGCHPAALLPTGTTSPARAPGFVSEVAPAGDHEPIAAAGLARDVPVMGTSRGGNDKPGGDFEMNGEVVDFARRPPGVAALRDLFALYVVGESMTPWRQPGDLVYCTRSRQARPGDYVVVELAAERDGDSQAALLKRLVGQRGSRFVLEQYNPPREIQLDAKRVRQLYRVIDWAELLGV